MTKPDLMEEAPVAWTGSGSLAALAAGAEGHIWPAKAEAHPIPLYSASALAAAEQRGREEEREKLAKRYDAEAQRLEQACIDALSVSDKLRLEGNATRCRSFAASIRLPDASGIWDAPAPEGKR